MPAPRDLHPLIVAVMEMWARSAGVPSDQLWAWVQRRERPDEARLSALLNVFFPVVRAEDFDPLPSAPVHATLATEMQPHTREQRVSRARLRRENRRHPFIAALVAKGMTVTELAEDIGYGRSTVQSWYDARPENARPIPRAAAEKVRDMLGVPLTAWRKITP